MTALHLDLKAGFDIDRGDQLLVLVPNAFDPVALLFRKTREREIPRMGGIKFINLLEIITAGCNRKSFRRIIIGIPKLVAGIQVRIKKDTALGIIRLLVMNLVRRIITLGDA